MPYSPNSLVSIIEKNKQKKKIANRIIESNPKNIPIIPKLIASKDTRNIEREKSIRNYYIFNNIYNRIKNIKENNRNIIKLFPDIELAIQILISSILSPKKMTNTELNYRLSQNFNNESTVLVKIIDIVKNYIKKEYSIEDKLPEILREALFESGASVYAIIPESSIDEVINTDLLSNYSTEEFKKKSDFIIHSVTSPINLLRNKKIDIKNFTSNDRISNFISTLISDEYLRISDNFNILKFSNIKEKVFKSIISKSLKQKGFISTESLENINYLDIFRTRNVSNSNSNVEYIKTKKETKRKSLGKPMFIKIPTESVIPVTIPGDRTQHVGYFVLLDENGKPLNYETETLNSNSFINDFSINSSNFNAVNLSPVQKAYRNLIYDSTNDIDFNQLFDIYRSVIEKQLYESIKNSLYGSNIEIANRNDIYFIMFSRALSEQRTNLLFIPKELIVYFAFYYNEIGVGKSLLENLSILSSLRAILTFSKIIAYAKQAIDVTKVNISLDPNDPDPEKTIEQIQESVLRLRQNYFPLGINNPVDLVNWIQRAGLQFSYDNNPLLPNVKIDFENANISHTIPSSELEDELRKQTIIALGLSPETIDNGFNPEFATTVVSNNILLSKRISIYQAKLESLLNKLINIILINDEEIRNELRKYIIENRESLNEVLTDDKKELLVKNKVEFIENFIDNIAENIEVQLPRPEVTNINNLAAEFDIYVENLDKVLNSIISNEVLTSSVAGDLSNNSDEIKLQIKHYLIRKWMQNNGFLTEVLDFIQDSIESKESESIIKGITNHIINTSRNSIKLFKELSKYTDAINKDLENITNNTSSNSGYEETSSESEKKENIEEDSEEDIDDLSF